MSLHFPRALILVGIGLGVSRVAPHSVWVPSPRSKLAASCAGCPTLRQSSAWFGCKLGCTVATVL